MSGWMIDILHAVRSAMLYNDHFLHNESKDEEDKLWAFDFYGQDQEELEMETDRCRIEHDEEVTEKILSML
jgi:hypothetical protein